MTSEPFPEADTVTETGYSITWPAADQVIAVDDVDSTEDPVFHYMPRWVVDCGDFEFGVMVDDHCFVVLVKSEHDEWVKTTHIPWQAARKLSELAETVTP
jgi:hypothetical protein